MFIHYIITPINKRPSVYPSLYINHIGINLHISNMYILSKNLEKVLSTQLSSSLTANNILFSFQRSYVPNKSTEIQITRVTIHILININKT